ncbi:hypothetical protein PJL18_00488 [Paenarthrobacter nicotinovorans]|nr:hypothetical protein [Paenarthrobacter nicotinovorans]
MKNGEPQYLSWYLVVSTVEGMSRSLLASTSLVWSSSQPWEANSEVQMTSVTKRSHSVDLPSSRCTICVRASSVVAPISVYLAVTLPFALVNASAVPL